MEWRLKAGIYVQALIRRAYAQGAAAFVAKRGDGDAGGLFIRVNRLDGCSGLLTFFTSIDGVRGARVVHPPDTKDEAIDEQLAREIARDPDIWVIEIEDRHARHFLEEKIEGKWG